MTYQVYYYLKQNGRAPLAEYLQGLKNERLVMAISGLINRLAEAEGRLPAKFVKPVYKKIYELRLAHYQGQQRIFYFIYQRGKIILLDGYTKKTNKIPGHILKRVKNYYFDYLIHQYEERPEYHLSRTPAPRS